MRINFSIIFIIFSLIALFVGALVGVLISVVYIYPEFLKDIIPFNQLRPLHTTNVVSWIVLCASGGIYFYIQKVEKIKLYSNTLGKVHLLIFILTGILILFSFISGKMGGREYFEYFPLLTLPILLGWLIFGLNYYLSLFNKVKNWPVYYWMWGVGIVFMIYHLTEAHFWAFTDVRSDFIKDMTIQWKSYGSFVGSWNMLVYGTAIYVMSKVKDNINLAHGKKTFFFFFLGLTNLMCGWAHHTYMLPTVPWIRYFAYLMSMTEWIILINIIYTWSKKLTFEIKTENLLTYKFIKSNQMWIFLNLFQSLLMSIPVLNYFTHGTHVTVAHSMGTTIGINTTILFTSIVFIISRLNPNNNLVNNKSFNFGYYLYNISLFVFWMTLMLIGVLKTLWTSEAKIFSTIHQDLAPYYMLMIFSGFCLFISLIILIFPMLRRLLPFAFNNEK